MKSNVVVGLFLLYTRDFQLTINDSTNAKVQNSIFSSFLFVEGGGGGWGGGYLVTDWDCLCTDYLYYCLANDLNNKSCLESQTRYQCKK